MARTLVTGATGFIGGHVVRQLLTRGDDVTASVREPAAAADLHALGVRVVKADVRDRRAMRRVMRGVERVFHIAGMADFSAPATQIFAVNLEGTRIVLEEALRAEVQRAVLTSSVAAIGPAPRGQSADENQPWTAGRYRLPYLDAKHEAEVAALRLTARGLPLVIVNPAHTFGPGVDPGRAGSSTTIVRSFMHRRIPAYVDGTVNVVGVQDVARGHLLADQRGRIGERYILGNRNYTFDRLFADLGRLSGIEPPALKLPLGAALALSAAGRRVAGLRLPSATAIRTASLNWAFVNRKARRELGWRPSPPDDCLEETIAWYRERDAAQLATVGVRQPIALRVAGGLVRRAPF